jgi:(1->4)-alpha-D-glucan 1-alpha-D-glucosylmutase
VPKLLITRDALHLRRRLPEVFTSGAYRPLRADGPAADHVVAFARTSAQGSVATVVPRRPLTLARAGGWRGTTVDLPWRAGVPLAELLGSFPVALLVEDEQ